jgi:NADH-quinone oxidoreductase subunit G
VGEALDAGRQVLVLDHTRNPTTDMADLTLPAATFAEDSGTLVNNEGRAQRFFNVVPPKGDVASAWRWIGHIQELHSGADPWPRLDVLTQECADNIPVFARIIEAAPNSHYRADGSPLARAPYRYSGRTSMYADKSVHEPAPVEDRDTPFTYSMEGEYGRQPPSTLPFFWAPGWNSEQSLNKFQDEVGERMRGGDPGVRLIEPPASLRDRKPRQSADDIPDPFHPRDDEWRLLPLHHIFGSDWLSALSAGIAERSPEPYLALNESGADRLGIEAGATVTLVIGGEELNLPLQVVPTLPDGTAGVPVGLKDMPYLDLPAWGRLNAKDGQS